MQNRLLGVLISLSLLLLSGCPERSAVRIEAGSSADSPVFGIGRTDHGPPQVLFPLESRMVERLRATPASLVLLPWSPGATWQRTPGLAAFDSK
jgi:hypothetical protein